MSNNLQTSKTLNKFEESLSNEKYTKGREIERTSKQYLRGEIPNAKSDTEKALDVGCGSGLNAAQIKAKGYNVYGVDLSPVAIEKFNQNGFNGTVADLGNKLPFEDNYFDIVFASEVIEHLVDTKFFLDELYRVLKPGGRIFLSTPNSAFWAFRLLTIIGKTPTDFQHPGHLRFFTPSSLRTWMNNSKFSVESTKARHMYFIFGEKFAAPFAKILDFIPFLKKELRFKTKKYYWHLSSFAKNASGFWADTIIITGKK